MAEHNGATVFFDDMTITCRRTSGLVERVTWMELRAVLIETNADGPFVIDLFWILVGNQNGCLVPMGAQGEDKLLDRLQQLPGFDHNAVIAAMSSVSSQRFLCWKRDENKE